MTRFLATFATAVWLPAVPLLLVACSASDPRGAAPHAGLSEASTNFDLEGVQPFLQRVASLVEGLSPTQVETLAAEVAAIPIESEREWTFTVRHRGAEIPLRVHAFMDDTDAPDLAFFTERELAAEIQQEMTRYAEEIGN